MKSFTFHQTTKIIFGSGKISELPEIALQFGNKVLLVTTPASVPDLEAQYDRVKKLLILHGLK
ncbi:MAG: hypothetical protein J7L96_02900, partial [Bacteroidales bacterium]|nr:hypothetical protein [Bacteroidales bacterium]